MRFDILTVLPGFFVSPLEQSIIGKAISNGLIDVRVHNIRDYATDRHRTTDDAPYGGGPGMVMKVEPIYRAIEALKDEGADATVILTTPQGTPFKQSTAKELTRRKRIVIVCGRYEGVDERIRDLVHMEISIGDYVVTGGEIPALTIIDAVSRLVSGVLGDAESAEDDSFVRGLLEYPHYTRPEVFMGKRVPEVLTTGDHGRIERWRRGQGLERTLDRRPELLKDAALTDEEREMLEEIRSRR